MASHDNCMLWCGCIFLAWFGSTCMPRCIEADLAAPGGPTPLKRLYVGVSFILVCACDKNLIHSYFFYIDFLWIKYAAWCILKTLRACSCDWIQHYNNKNMYIISIFMPSLLGPLQAWGQPLTHTVDQSHLFIMQFILLTSYPIKPQLLPLLSTSDD